MNKLEELWELVGKATADIEKLEEEFEAARKLLAPFLAEADKRFAPALSRQFERGLQVASAHIRLEVIKRAVAIMKGKEEKK